VDAPPCTPERGLSLSSLPGKLMMQEGANTETVIRSIEHISNKYPLLTLVSLLVVVILPTFVSLLRERHLRKAFEGTIRSQENEIKRIAADNKDWREHFFRLKGLTEGEVLAPPPSGPPSSRSDKRKGGSR